MSEAASTFIERVESRLAEDGTSAREFSLRVTGKPDFLRDIKRRRHLPSAANLERAAEVLGVTTDWLVGRSSTPDPVQSEVSLHDRAVPWRGFEPEGPGIPLVGTGDCAELELDSTDGQHVRVERASFDPEYHVRYIARPPALRGALEIYAIYFHGESMVPRFEPGEVGIVDPRRPAGNGDYVLVQLTNGEEDEVASVLVKRLVRQSSAEVVLEQFNPPMQFAVPKRMVKRVHRIVPQTELLF